MIRLIVTDVDGTLGPVSTAEIHKDYYEVIEKLLDKGIIFGAASGRSYKALSRLFEPLSDRMLFLSDNGARCCYKGKELFSLPMSQDDSRELIKDTRSLSGCQCVCQTGENTYFGKEDEEVYKIMRDQMHYDVTMLDDLSTLTVPVLKYTVYHRCDAEKATEGYFQDKWKKTHQVACAGENYMDVMRMDANKGNGILRIQEYFQIKPEESMAFGDNINDIEMLHNCYYSYAVGDARDEVKKEARYEAPPMKEDGVLQVLKALLN